jgi:hypothetical protein
MQHRLLGLRGNAYVSRMKEIMKADGALIVKRFEQIIAEDGRFTPKHLGILASEFRLPLTVLDDYLPDLTGGRYPSGTWERLRQRGYTAKAIGVQWD